MSGNPYDLAIIGAGSAGLIAADFARKLGARVILLERERIGGDCTWTGCVPSKSLLKVARVAHEMRTAARFGVQSHEPIVNMVEVRDYLRSTIDRIYEGTTSDALRLKNIDVRFGAVRFVDPHNLPSATSDFGPRRSSSRPERIDDPAAARTRRCCVLYVPEHFRERPSSGIDGRHRRGAGRRSTAKRTATSSSSLRAVARPLMA
jgi:NADPH-dependent 2,4-dienoyl-CoA reductase/sulfur reductase-like enzyme